MGWTQSAWFEEWIKKRRRLFGMSQGQIAQHCWPQYRFIQPGFPLADLDMATHGLANQTVSAGGHGNCTFDFDMVYSSSSGEEGVLNEKFDLEKIPGLKEPTLCCKKCDEHPKCKYFSYHVFTGTCVLKTPDAYTSKQVMEGYISGTTWIVNRTLFATTIEFGDICPCAPCCWGRLRFWSAGMGIGGAAIFVILLLFGVTEVYRRCSGRGHYRLTDGHEPSIGELMFLVLPTAFTVIWTYRGFYIGFLSMCSGCKDTHLWRSVFFLSCLSVALAVLLPLIIVCAMVAGEDARVKALPPKRRQVRPPEPERNDAGYPTVPYYYVNSYGYVPSDEPAPLGGRDPHSRLPPPPAPHVTPITYRQFQDQPVPLWHGGVRSS